MKGTRKITMRCLLLASLLPLCFSFILNGDPCVVPTPCRCYSSTVDCGYRRLQQLPPFYFSERHYRELTIYLQNNQISVLPDHAFNNISETGAETVTIDISNNNIHSIHSTAFGDFGNMSLYLRLTNNKLTFLPRALSNIRNLKELRLFENDIVFLSGAVLSSIGKTLEIFQLDMNSLAIWPTELANLHVLKELEVTNVQFGDIPDNSFNGLTNLDTLRITYSKLHRVPDAICSLTNLVRLQFSENTDVQNFTTGILPTVCQTKFEKLVVADLMNNNMYTFPDNVFSMFPTLRQTGLRSNYLESINYDSVPTNCSLYYLYLSNNNFREIPPAVSKMTNLRTVIMTDNTSRE